MPGKLTGAFFGEVDGMEQFSESSREHWLYLQQ
jgi:hypothetical protein